MEHLVQDKRFVTNEKRLENYEPLNALIKAYVLTKTKEELQDKLAELNVPCAPVLSIAETMVHPQLETRNMIVGLDDPVFGTFNVRGIPIKLEKSHGRIGGPAPELG